MNISECTPSPDYRGPIRISTSEFGWDLAEMVGMSGHGADDVIFTVAGHTRKFTCERRWVLLDGCQNIDRALHKHVGR